MDSSQSALDHDRVVSALPHIHEAVERLLQAWDAIGAAERILDFEITTGELQDLAGGIDDPGSVPAKVTFKVVTDWLERIRFAAK